METGVNQLGFVSSYSPIADDEHGSYTAAPEYFGMQAFAQASHGKLVSLDYNPGSINLTAYAVESAKAKTIVTVVNKDAAQSADLVISSARPIRRANASHLSAPSLDAKEDVKLSSDRTVKLNNGECFVQVAASTAAIIVLE